jgi:uncharacterized protein (TIRG00374 family)
MNKFKNGFIALIGLSISLLVIILVIKDINFILLKSSFQKFRPHGIILMIITYLFGFIIRGIRWKYMLSPIKKISTYSTTEGVIVGYMGNNLLPARAGEIIRAVYIGNTECISKTTAFGTVAIERLFDGLVIVGILLFS